MTNDENKNKSSGLNWYWGLLGLLGFLGLILDKPIYYVFFVFFLFFLFPVVRRNKK
jgi:hypothetical protein